MPAHFLHLPSAERIVGEAHLWTDASTLWGTMPANALEQLASSTSLKMLSFGWYLQITWPLKRLKSGELYSTGLAIRLIKSSFFPQFYQTNFSILNRPM